VGYTIITFGEYIMEQEDKRDQDKIKAWDEAGKEIPMDKSSGKKHKGYENLKSWKPGQSGNPKGKKKGCKTLKNRLKDDLRIMTWIKQDPELADMIANLDNIDMFNALKTTAFAQFVQNPSDEDAYKRAYQAVAEDRQYTEGKVIRQEVNQTIVSVSDMTMN